MDKGKNTNFVPKHDYDTTGLTPDEIKTLRQNVDATCSTALKSLDTSYYQATSLNIHSYQKQLKSVSNVSVCQQAISLLSQYQTEYNNEPKIAVYVKEKEWVKYATPTLYFPNEGLYLMTWHHALPNDKEHYMKMPHCATSMSHMVLSIVQTNKEIAHQYGGQFTNSTEPDYDEYNTNPKQYASFLHRFGMALLRTKHKDTALSKHEQALEIRKEEYGDIHYEVAFSYGHICAHYVNINNMDEAEKYAYTALSVMQKYLQAEDAAQQSAKIDIENGAASQVALRNLTNHLGNLRICDND